MKEFLSPEEARFSYNLTVNTDEKLSPIERILEEEGIVAIEMPLSSADFENLSHGYAICLEECPELLAQTTHNVDTRFGAEVGHVRKEKKLNEDSGVQVSDPKNYFHFNERARGRWQEQFAHGPKLLRDFLADGYEVQDALIGVAKRNIRSLETTHPNISRLYFPNSSKLGSDTFLRLLRYDGYAIDGSLAQLSAIAKPHYDIGGMTIQAYADAEGFWGAVDKDKSGRHHNTQENTGYLFAGKGHEKIYGISDPIKPLWHGVDRIIPAGVTYVPERTAVILFVNAPNVDYEVRPTDTVPYMLGARALACV